MQRLSVRKRSLSESEVRRSVDPMSAEQHSRPAEDVVLVRCAWCERIRVAPDEWVEADKDFVGHALLDRESHGICPACLARIAASSA